MSFRLTGGSFNFRTLFCIQTARECQYPLGVLCSVTKSRKCPDIALERYAETMLLDDYRCWRRRRMGQACPPICAHLILITNNFACFQHISIPFRNLPAKMESSPNTLQASASASDVISLDAAYAIVSEMRGVYKNALEASSATNRGLKVTMQVALLMVCVWLGLNFSSPQLVFSPL